MIWTLRRYQQTEEWTLGYIETVEGRLLHTLELPWRGNVPNVSRIPADRYSMRPEGGDLKRIRLHGGTVADLSISITPMTARTQCDLHVGNWTSQIRGCILVGEGMGWDFDERQPMVNNSRDAMQWLYRQIELDSHPELLIEERF